MNRPSFLLTLSVPQLERIWRRLYQRATKDMFGCDWLTLGLSNPGLFFSMRAVHSEMIRRIQVDLDAIELP
jgi:hypothetical protein